MAILLEDEQGRRVTIDTELATIGRNTTCALAFPDDPRVEAEHATLRRVAHRWLIEARGECKIRVGSAEPARLAWLQPGDVIRLSATGPTLTFEPSTVVVREGGLASPRSNLIGESPTAFLTAPVQVAKPREPRSYAASPGRSMRWLAVVGCGTAFLIGLIFFIAFPRINEPLSNPSPPVTNVPGPIEPSPVDKTSADTARNGDSEGTVPPGAEPSVDETGDEHESDNDQYGAIVWLGCSYGRTTFFYHTGCLIAPTRVLSTASVIGNLELIAREGHGIFAYAGGRMIPVKTLRTHPRYDFDDPVNPPSPHYNLGVAILEQPLEDACRIASKDESKAITLGTHLLVLGFVRTPGDFAALDPLRVPLQRLDATIDGSEPSLEARQPNYLLNVDAPQGLEGAAVLNREGRLVGLLAPEASTVKMISIAHAAELLEGE